MKFIKIVLILIVFSGCEKLLFHEIIVENSTEHGITIEGYYEA